MDLFQTVFVQFVVQGAGLNSQQRGPLGLDVVGLLHGLGEQLALDLSEALVERHRAGRDGLVVPSGFVEGQRQIVVVDLFAIGEDNGALDDIFQLAHIARPGVANQPLERLVT